MIKVINLVGARPQFVKAAAISKVISEKFSDQVQEILVHSGQHYDAALSEVFFNELDLSTPSYFIESGSGSHAKQTSAIMMGVEDILLKEQPDVLLVYGDTNTTLAGAITAAKLHIPVAHIESGLRSFNMQMPEEVNRILTDRISDWLFCFTDTSVVNLKNEGVEKGVYRCGDIMLDTALQYGDKDETFLNDHGLYEGSYILCTIHRPSNTDDTDRLYFLLDGLLKKAKQENKKLLLPLHPRTRKAVNDHKARFQSILDDSDVVVAEPFSYLRMLAAEKNAWMIATDSGGVQKEAYFFKKPCMVLRTETEWVEIIDSGCAELAYDSKEGFDKAFDRMTQGFKGSFHPLFGDGKAGMFIIETLIETTGDISIHNKHK